MIGFNVGVDAIAEEYARQHGVEIEIFTIIYKLTERIHELLHAARPKREVEDVVGRAKVQRQFSSRKDMRVIGGSVSDGYLARGSTVRVLRRKAIVGTGKIRNLQANKSDVDRVLAGSEFGAQVESNFEMTQGDVLECITVEMQ